MNISKAIKLAALMEQRILVAFTKDSITSFIEFLKDIHKPNSFATLDTLKAKGVFKKIGEALSFIRKSSFYNEGMKFEDPTEGMSRHWLYNLVTEHLPSPEMMDEKKWEEFLKAIRGINEQSLNKALGILAKDAFNIGVENKGKNLTQPTLIKDKPRKPKYQGTKPGDVQEFNKLFTSSMETKIAKAILNIIKSL